jgi:menaquinone-dependent protoporphyrinogen oxidase
MTQNILVTYASRTGSTAEVAEVIQNFLAESGSNVDLLPMQSVQNIDPYDAITAGSAIQNRQWLPEAMDFVHHHKASLAQKPIAIFSLCMTLAMRDGEKYRPQVSEWISPVRRSVLPVSEGLFAGILDISRIPSFSDRLKFRLSVAFGVWSEGDHRDWDSINTWASALYPQLMGIDRPNQ